MKPPQNSTKPLHRRGRPSIDKSQVSKPFPILTLDDRDLFDVIASGSTQTRARRVPKVAEKKVKIHAPDPIKSGPQPTPRVADVSSQSWYTPASAQPPTTDALQRSVTNTTPRTTPTKVDVSRANSTTEFRGHIRTGSETRRDGIEPTKRHVPKHLITHPDCPWVESNGDRNAHAGYLAQHRPVRSATTGSHESDKTAVEDEAPIRVDTKEEGWATPPAKAIQYTLHPTLRLVSKPLPDPPTFDTLSSRWSQSTGSVYSSDDPFRYDHILDMFPDPPVHMPTATHFDDWEDFNSLSTPPDFMSCSNHSSSSVATITPADVMGPAPVKPLMLKAMPKPKVVSVVHQTTRASRSFTHIQDSILIQKGRANPRVSMKGSIHTSVRGTGAAPTVRRRSSSLTSSHGRRQPVKPANPQNILALVKPYYKQGPETIAGYERAHEESTARYAEQERIEDFRRDFGYNPYYRRGKRYLDDPKSERPGKVKRLKWLGKLEKVKRRKWL